MVVVEEKDVCFSTSWFVLKASGDQFCSCIINAYNENEGDDDDDDDDASSVAPAA